MPFRRIAWLDLGILLALTLLALALRVYQLHEIPPGLYFDEAANGVDAQGVLTGTHSIFFERNYGREPLLIYLQAISIALLGATPFALRLVSAVIGALTVPAVYWMVREAFRSKGDEARWLALWTSLFVALSYWHINFSRIGFRAILVPLLSCLAFACFWRAWRHIESGDRFPWLPLIACGLFVGASLYTYTAARFLPVLIVLTVVAGVLMPERRAARTRRAILALAVIGVTGLAAFAPLGIHFASHPDAFFGRVEQLSVFNPQNNEGNLVKTLIGNTVKTIGMFGWAGDPKWLHNPAERPVFDPLLALWLAAGVVLAFFRRRSLPHVSTLLWCIIFTLPALLTVHEMPHSLRMLGMIPAVYVLPVLAMSEIGTHLAGRWRVLINWLPLPFLLFSGSTSIHDYFTAWGDELDFYAFHTIFADTAEVMSGYGSADGVWIMPIDKFIKGQERISHYTIDFLYQGPAGYGAALVDPAVAPTRLSSLTQGRNQAYLMRWDDTRRLPMSAYSHADPKGLFDFLLRKHGKLLGETDTGEMSYRIYQIPYKPDYRVATAFTPQDVRFAGFMKLIGSAYGHIATSRAESADELEDKVLASGESAWVVLRWEAQTAIDLDLKTTLYLIDADGHRAGQIDSLLVADENPFLRSWSEGEVAYTYHIFPTLPAIPPGMYQLYLGVYDETAQQRFSILEPDGSEAGTAFLLGALEITPPINSPLVTPDKPLPAETSLVPGVSLLGYDLPAGPLGPGQSLPLALYWQAAAAPQRDYLIRVELRDASGHSVATRLASPANGRYPMTRWSAGEVLRDWQDLTIPATVPSGDYELVVTLDDGSTPVGEITLETVQVRDRPHTFEPPQIQHPMNLRVGDRIAFLGYDLSTEDIQAGEGPNLTLYWQAIDNPMASYTVFTHLLSSDGQNWGGKDNIPGEGSLPTIDWVTGEYITDSYAISVDTNAPAGEYQIEVGMYDAATGNRLPVTNASGQVLGDRILLSSTIDIAEE